MIFKKIFKKNKKVLVKDISEDIYSEIELSCSVLLAEAALMDENLDKAEERIIENLLAKNFNLQIKSAKGLLKKALEICENNNDLVQYTRTIKEKWSLEERIKFLEMMWKVVLVDQNLDPYEDMIIRRVAGLIYVSDKDRSKAKKNAAKYIAQRDF